MVSIITVNYNGWRDTCAMIDSLARYESYPYEVIVVDNASAGNDADRIAALHPEVTLVRSQHNLGFAGGNNLGIAHAQGDYLFFLNNDTEIKSPILARMVEPFERDPKIGGLSPLIRFYHTPDAVQYAGDWKLTPITLRNRYPDAHLPHRHEVSRQVEVMHGAAMMLPRSVIDHIGPMYEGYFLFYEEFDWSYALLRAGYTVWFESTAVVYHKEGQSIGLRTPLRERYLVRARLLFASRWVSPSLRWLSYSYQIGPVLCRNLLRDTLHRQWPLVKANLQGVWGFLCGKTGKE